MQRFLTIMSVFFFVCGVVSLWRILSDDGRDIWYVPLVPSHTSVTIMKITATVKVFLFIGVLLS